MTGWDGVYLFAKLVKLNGDSELRTYFIDRESHKEDMAWLESEVERFWANNVTGKEAPKAVLQDL